MLINSPIGGDPIWLPDTPENLANFAAIAVDAAANQLPAQPAPSMMELLQQQYGIDLTSLDRGLADAVRSKLSLADGKLNVSGLYYNGLGDDLTSKIAQSRADLTEWIPQGGKAMDAGGDSGATYLVPISSVTQYSGGGGILRSDSPPETALSSLNALLTLAQHAPPPPPYLTAAEAMVFDRLIAGTGDYNWARMQEETLKGVLHALRANPDGSLNMSAIYGGGLGYDPGPPSNAYAVSRELWADQNNGRPTGQYSEWVNFGTKDSRLVSFTAPDPSVGRIVMETRGPANSPVSVPVYKPSEATLAKYQADLAQYNDTFGRLRTEKGTLVQVHPNGLGLNIGNENGYYSAENMGWHPAFGLFTMAGNIKPEESGWFFSILETVVPMFAGAVFAWVGGPVGSFVYTYLLTDGDLDKAFLSAALTAVTAGMTPGVESAATGALAAQTTGFANALGVTDTLFGAAVNNAAASALGAAANGGDLDDVLAAGLAGAATGALGSYVTASVTPDLGNVALGRAIGDGVAGIASSALTDGDIGDAAMRGLLNIAATAAGQSVVNAGFSDSSLQVQAAVAAGTSALVNGLAASTMNDVPLGVTLGTALGAGLVAAMRTPETPTAQISPVPLPGPIELRDLEPLPAVQGEFVGPPEPAEDPASALPAPAASSPNDWDWYDSVMPVSYPAQIVPGSTEPVENDQPSMSTDVQPVETLVVTSNDTAPTEPAPTPTGWEWYDDGAAAPALTAMVGPPAPADLVGPPAPETETGSADETAPVDTPADTSTDQYPTGGSAPLPYTVPGSDYKAPTSVIARPGDNIIGLVGDDRAAIGDFAIRNGLRNSTIIAGKEYDTTPMDVVNLTPEQIKLREEIGDNFIRQDNARLAALAEQARQIQIAAQRQAAINQQAARARDGIFDAGSTGLDFGSSPLTGPGSLSGPGPNVVDVNAWRRGSTGNPYLDTSMKSDFNAWKDGSANSTYLASAAEWSKAQPAPLTRQERARQEIENAVQTLEDGAAGVLQWVKENPRTMGAVQAAGGLAETVASAGLFVSATAATATVVGAPAGVPLQVLAVAGMGNGLDNLSTGVQTAWNRAYQPTVTQQLAGATASALGASPETVETVEAVAGIGQAMLGAGATGQVMALRPLPYTSVRPAPPPAAETSAFTPKLTETAEAARQAMKDIAAESLPPSFIPAPAKPVLAVETLQSTYIPGPTKLILSEFDQIGPPALLSRTDQWFNSKGQGVATVSDIYGTNPVTNAMGRGTAADDSQQLIGKASSMEIGQPSSGGHLTPSGAVGNQLGKNGLVGEPIAIQREGNPIDLAVVDLFNASKPLPSGALKDPNASYFGRLETMVDYGDNYFTPTTVTRKLTVYDMGTTLESGVRIERPVERLTVVSDHTKLAPVPENLTGNVKTDSFIWDQEFRLLSEQKAADPSLKAVTAEPVVNLTGSAPEIRIPYIETQPLPLSLRVQYFDEMRDLAILRQPANSQSGAYNPIPQIAALKGKGSDLMPTAAEISALAERMGVPVTPGFMNFANDQRIQEIATIRFNAAARDIRLNMEQSVPSLETIEAAQLKMDRAQAIFDFYAGPKLPEPRTGTTSFP